MGLLRKGKTPVEAKFQRTDLAICCHSREGKTPSYSQINTVCYQIVLRVFSHNLSKYKASSDNMQRIWQVTQNGQPQLEL